MPNRSNQAKKAAEKAVKKSHPATVFLAVLFLLIGIAAGIAVSTILTKNDMFELKGEKLVRLELGASYEEKGVTIISFGKDISAKVERSGDIDGLKENPSEGVYQIVYTVEDFRWGDYQLVRTIVVGNPEGVEDLLNG